MATEKAQRIIFDEADFEPRESATAAPVIGSEHQSGPAANAPADDGGRSLIVLDQERRLLAVRDINSKLGSLEGNVSRLSAAFGQSQQTINNTLLDIQRRSARMTADILGLVSSVDKNSEQQGQLDSRLKAGMNELREQLAQASSSLKAQYGRIDQLESGQKSLLKLHDGLAVMSRQQGDALQSLNQQTHQHGRQIQALGGEARKQAESLQALGNDSLEHAESIKALGIGQRQQSEGLRALTSEARTQLQANRTHIDGLQALHREQKQLLEALTADFEMLTERTSMLADQLLGLSTDVAQERHWVRKGFQYAGGALAAVAVIILAVMAYCQFHPVTVPDSVRTELAGLNTLMSKQTAAQQSMAADMQALQGRVASLGAGSEAQATEIAQMQKEVQHSVSVLHRIRRSEAAINREMSGLEGRMDKVEQAQPKAVN